MAIHRAAPLWPPAGRSRTRTRPCALPRRIWLALPEPRARPLGPRSVSPLPRCPPRGGHLVEVVRWLVGIRSRARARPPSEGGASSGSCPPPSRTPAAVGLAAVLGGAGRRGRSLAGAGHLLRSLPGPPSGPVGGGRRLPGDVGGGPRALLRVRPGLLPRGRPSGSLALPRVRLAARAGGVPTRPLLHRLRFPGAPLVRAQVTWYLTHCYPRCGGTPAASVRAVTSLPQRMRSEGPGTGRPFRTWRWGGCRGGGGHRGRGGRRQRDGPVALRGGGALHPRSA